MIELGKEQKMLETDRLILRKWTEANKRDEEKTGW